MPVFDHATATTATLACKKADVISSADGLDLALFSQGDPTKPTVVLVHGFPDDHRVWDGLAARLSEDHHVVTYDVRGAGESSIPRRIADYRLDALVADLQAVIDYVDDDSGSYWRRVRAWVAASPLLALLWARGTAYLMSADPELPADQRKIRLRDVRRAYRSGYVFTPWDTVKMWAEYLRPSYHPRNYGSTSQAVAYLASSPVARAAT